jgi:hypothetical protein
MLQADEGGYRALVLLLALIPAVFATLAWIVLVVSLRRTRPTPPVALKVLWIVICLLLTACTYGAATFQGVGP